jgi:hypothetical protein
MRVDGDLYVPGTLGCGNFSPAAGAVKKAAIDPFANLPYTAHQSRPSPTYAQPNAAATTETKVVHVVYGATGTILAFRAGSIVANIGAATVTVDLKKNGVSVLTGVITLNNANTARVAVAGTLGASLALVAGDVLEVVCVATAGGGTLATGVFAQAVLSEDAQ